VGRPRASSREFVWRDWVPPRTAANACNATRTTFTSGCWAVRVEPAVWAWKRSIIDLGSLAWKRSCMMRAQRRRAARNLATSSRKLLWALKEKESLWAKVATDRAAALDD